MEDVFLLLFLFVCVRRWPLGIKASQSTRLPPLVCGRSFLSSSVENEEGAEPYLSEPQPRLLGFPYLQKCVLKFAGGIWVVTMSRIWWEKSGETFRGMTFSTCQELKVFANSWTNFWEDSRNFISNSASFFGNFVQQKGGSDLSCTRLRVPPVALHVSRYTCRSWFPGFYSVLQV